MVSVFFHQWLQEHFISVKTSCSLIIFLSTSQMMLIVVHVQWVRRIFQAVSFNRIFLIDIYIPAGNLPGPKRWNFNFFMELLAKRVEFNSIDTCRKCTASWALFKIKLFLNKFIPLDLEIWCVFIRDKVTVQSTEV